MGRLLERHLVHAPGPRTHWTRTSPRSDPWPRLGPSRPFERPLPGGDLVPGDHPDVPDRILLPAHLYQWM